MAYLPLWTFSLLMHAFVGWRVAPALIAVSPTAGYSLWALLLLSGAAVPMGLVAKRITRTAHSEWLTWAGLLCMGLFSSLFVLTLVREVLLLVAYAFSAAGLGDFDVAEIVTASAIGLVPLALLMTVWGFFNARRTAQVVRVDVPIANLPPALMNFTMAQISDVHVGPTIKGNYLDRIVQRVNQLGADMVAITGDLVDGSVGELGAHVQPLSNLRSTHGTFFVTGNHEYYSGAHAWIAWLRGLGITVLMNEHVVVHHTRDASTPSHPVVIAGVADYSAHHFDESHRSDAVRAMAGAPDHSAFKLLMAHQPRSAAHADLAGFHLQLSGHTHGGQFWPWGHFVRLQQPFTAGLRKLGKLWVYTSRGTGYWGPPKRFGSPSEITLLRLVKA